MQLKIDPVNDKENPPKVMKKKMAASNSRRRKKSRLKRLADWFIYFGFIVVRVENNTFQNNGIFLIS